jgi:photosystem II stability/assembly factor-like uncharacterized protein
MTPATIGRRIELWSVSPDGQLLQRNEQGATQVVTVVQNARWRSVTSIGADVWAAGDGGLLYRSGDSGRTWARLPSPSGQSIVRVAFENTRDGMFATVDGHRYVTHDGGQTWLGAAGQ